ncbi:DUF3696 domain-containing protein [Hamadaea sp. NPDC051192]|uniref:AAA family ATPase n=1 Tax=Hamadaea sp. NPDC051192 TaxID=3154940 RepID=UPI00342E7C51
MPLQRIAVENYRCFRDRQEMEILPVTVVFGRNNAGKSALVRSPLIFASGLTAESSAPIDIDALVDLGLDVTDDFTDLIFEHSPHGNIGISLTVDGERPFDLDVTLQYIDEAREAVVSSLILDDGHSQLRLHWEQSLFQPGTPESYQIFVDGALVETRLVEFHGLLPTPESIPRLRTWLAQERSVGPVRYLSSYREPVARVHRLPMGQPKPIRGYGQGVSSLLAHDRVRGKGEVLARVNAILGEIVEGWQLDEVENGSFFETVLRRRPDDPFTVNLADAGTGVAQMLPILVQCALDQINGSGGALQVIEEPEMHLHPKAHAALADLYLKTAAETGTRFLIETHSETLLLRLRRRIAEGACAPEMVGVYVVEQDDGDAVVRRVHIDELGNLADEWPEGYFSQDYQEVRAIAAAQIRRSGDAA